MIAQANNVTGRAFLEWPLSNVTDGRYDIGVRVVCKGQTYIAASLTGVIDRTAPRILASATKPINLVPIPFGSPISVTFSEAILCNAVVTSIRPMGGSVLSESMYSVVCQGAVLWIDFSAATVKYHVH